MNRQDAYRKSVKRLWGKIYQEKLSGTPTAKLAKKYHYSKKYMWKMFWMIKNKKYDIG